MTGLAPEVFEKLQNWLSIEEGNIPYVYKDQAGLNTIGIGHLIRNTELKELSKYTKSNPAPSTIIDKLFVDDISAAVTCVLDINSQLPSPLNNSQIIACVSLCFNIGNTAFRNSTVVKKLLEGQLNEAARAFEMWKYITVKGKKQISDGLLLRRLREERLFLLGT